MNKFLQQLERDANLTITENGAVALNSTLNSMLDAFGSLGAMRDSDEDTIIRVFNLALAENKELAMRLLFYIRDVREGQGSRRVFRVINKYLAESQKDLVIKNLPNFLEFGRADDMLCLLDTSIKQDVLAFIGDQLYKDVKSEKPSLLAKWLPSENASSQETKRYAKIIIDYLKISGKRYRKILVDLRKRLDVVEVKMSSNKWETINYNNVPSKASLLYRNAFLKQDEARYNQYLKNLLIGKAKTNAGALFPQEIVAKILNKKIKKTDRILFDAMWNNLPDYFNGIEENSLCLVDTSGSMEGTPLEAAISLGIYASERCKGVFHNKFITFSSRPSLETVVGNDIVDKVINLSKSSWGFNTDIEKVFDLILNAAITSRATQDEMPSKLYILSDMQFDKADSEVDKTLMQSIKDKFKENGYEMPSIIYWNLRASACGMFQDDKYGDNIAFVSGYSPVLFKNVLEGTTYEKEENSVKAKVDPIEVMNKALLNQRYDVVYFG